MGEWQTEPLIDCLAALIDYRGKSPPKSKKGIPVLSAKVVKSTGLLWPIEQMIEPDFYTKWMTRGLPQPDDVVMTTEAPMGEVIQLDEETAQFALGQRIVCMRGKRNKLDNTFLRYQLVSPAQQQILSSYATGTTVLGISQKALRSMPISFPSLAEQKWIGQVLGALDDKIDLNRRMNETLESMARAIFKDWFVDFGPTRAKAEGGEPYLAPGLWDLFPDGLDDEDKPVGWSVCPVSELFEFNPRESVKKETYRPYLNMAALPTSGAVADAPIYREYKSGSKFRDGDSLFARITPCLENGKTAYVFDMGNGIVGTGSTEFIVIRSRTPLPAPASYFLARDPEFRDHAERSMTGTSGRQRASREALSQYELATPTDDQLWKALGDFVTPMMDRVIANARESRALARTRNLLLPKLMSGEIRLGEAEKAMEAVI